MASRPLPSQPPPSRRPAIAPASKKPARPMPGQPARPLLVTEIKAAPRRRGAAPAANPAAAVRTAPASRMTIPASPRTLVPPGARRAPKEIGPKTLPFPGKQALPSPAAATRRRRYEEHGDAELAEMARRHLAYEIKMLRETAAALQGKGIGPRGFRNAMLETFLIHYRNLLDFFYADKRRALAHDVSAAHYVIDPKRWKERRPRMDKEATSSRERVNAQLAHLTYRRLKYHQRNWSDRRMLRQIEELIENFAQQLPARRRRWFQRCLND